MGENLLDITNRLQQLLFKADECEQNGESFGLELADQINALVDKQADKIDNSVTFHNFCDSQIEWLKSEKLKLDNLIKRYERAQERLEYLANIAMIADKTTELVGKTKKIAFRKSEFVEVIAQNEIPDSYMRVKTTIEIDKQKIKEDLKKGLDVQGAALGIRQSVVFK